MLAEETSRIIEMAWEDRTPFEAIEAQFEAECFRGLVEEDLGNLPQAQQHYQLALNLADHPCER